MMMLDPHLLEEINEAADRGDERIKQELLEYFEEVRCFAENLSRPNGLTGKGVLGSTTHPLAPNAESIIRLAICLFVFQNGREYPPDIDDWYLKASAWSMAEAGLWDELPDN